MKPKKSKIFPCQCGLWETNPEILQQRGALRGYCGFCQMCGLPGHTRAHQTARDKQPVIGSWCDLHYAHLIKLQEKENDKLLQECYCGLWENNPDVLIKQGVPRGYCGLCIDCGKPGHTRHYPGAPFTGAWCEEHWNKIIESTKKKTKANKPIETDRD